MLDVGLPEPVGGELGQAAEARRLAARPVQVGLALAREQVHRHVDRDAGGGYEEDDVEHALA